MRIVIAGGGTGGHLTPGLAVAATLRAKSPKSDIIIIGRSGGVAERLVEKGGFRLLTIKISGVDVQRPITLIRFALELPQSYIQARSIMRELRPDIVVGTSGYVCVPVMLAANRSHIPTILLEQNAMPGRATRLLAKLAKAVVTSFPTTEQHLHARRIIYSGNPIRPTITAKRGKPLHDACTHILVMGGSQGARPINRAITGGIEDFLHKSPEFQVTHQCGKADFEWVTKCWEQLPEKLQNRYHVAAFFDDIGEQLKQCDITVMRAGGSSLAECAGVGRPMILVPYPHAGGHQSYNIAFYANQGAAVSIPDEECSSQQLWKVVDEIVEDPKRWKKMTAASYEMGKPQASNEVCELIEQVVAA